LNEFANRKIRSNGKTKMIKCKYKSGKEEMSMKNDSEQLKILLGFWLDHNEEHTGEFSEWAGKIATQNKEVSDLIKKAVESMNESNSYLKKAKALLG
jgi:hypothetical protein